MNRIEWTAGEYATHTGRVNGLVLFEIVWSSRKGEGELLKSELPGFKRARPVAGVDVGKELAERVLVAFAAKIGAPFAG